MKLFRIIFKDGKHPQFIEAFTIDAVRFFMKTLGYIEPEIIIEEF
jgi:hypothetical protein